MAVLIVVILHMHLAAGDQTLAVALATAGWALEERINQRHETTTVFHTGNMGDFCHFRTPGFKGDCDSDEWSFWRVKYCPLRANWLFTIHIYKFSGTTSFKWHAAPWALTSVHSPVIQMSSQGWVLQLSMSGGLIWLTQYISWTSFWLWSTHFKARLRWPAPHDLLHCNGEKTEIRLLERGKIMSEFYWEKHHGILILTFPFRYSGPDYVCTPVQLQTGSCLYKTGS